MINRNPTKMGEQLQDTKWTDEDCQGWVDGFQRELSEHLASGGDWAEFSQDRVGTVPLPVKEYIGRQVAERLRKREEAQSRPRSAAVVPLVVTRGEDLVNPSN